MRRAIAHQQTFAETRERLDVITAHACNEPVDGFGVPSHCVALFSAHDLQKTARSCPPQMIAHCVPLQPDGVPCRTHGLAGVRADRFSAYQSMSNE